MSLCVIDSSVAFKWYRQPADEDHVTQAAGILENHYASFLALSDLLDCAFITADKKLYAKIKSSPNTKFLGNL